MAFDFSPYTPFVYAVVVSQFTGTLIATTARNSLPRVIGVFVLAFILYQQLIKVPYIRGFDAVRGTAASSFIVVFLQSVNLLLITGIDANDLICDKLADASMGIRGRIDAAMKLIGSPRAIGTGWQVKGTPPHPAFYEPNRKSPDRGIFVLRQTLIFISQYLLIDAITTSFSGVSIEDRIRLMGPGTQFLFWGATSEQWMARIKISLIGWFVVSRLLIDATYRICSIVAVVLGGSSPEVWPPFFGSMWDAYTIRGFWGTFWHQALRWSLTSWSSLITQTLLRLPRPSLIERYLNILIVFSLSGLIHLATDLGSGLKLYDSGAVFFFISFAFGIMVEDGIQEAWRRLTGTQKSEVVPMWKKVIGFVWVAAFICAVTPLYAYPNVQEPKPAVPYSVAEKTGVSAAATAAVVGMLISKIWLGGEP